MKKAFPEARTEILDRLHAITPNATREWGKMSPHQMVCHLMDSYELAMGERNVAGKSNFFNRTFIKWAALNLPMKWPPGVQTMPELDQAAGAGTPPSVFAADVAKLLKSIDRFSASPRDFKFAPHPIFAAMTEWEWMRWGYLHADHHLRQFGL